MTGAQTPSPGQGRDLSTPPDPPSAGSATLYGNLWLSIRRFLATLGRHTRSLLHFTLVMMGAGWGVVRESCRKDTWRRTVRYEFRRTLSDVAGRGLLSALVTGVLAGIAVVSQAIYWLGLAGMEEMTGSVLVTVVVREITPILVGILMLGRNGMLTFTALGLQTTEGQTRAMIAEGLDPFLLIVVPRTLAYTVASFTLGIFCSVAALLTGYIISRVTGVVSHSLLSFLYDVVTAMTPADYLLIPLKFVVEGFFVGLGCTVGGLTVTPDDTIQTMMPRGFGRGMLFVMAVSVLFSLSF